MAENSLRNVLLMLFGKALENVSEGFQLNHLPPARADVRDCPRRSQALGNAR